MQTPENQQTQCAASVFTTNGLIIVKVKNFVQ